MLSKSVATVHLATASKDEVQSRKFHAKSDKKANASSATVAKDEELVRKINLSTITAPAKNTFSPLEFDLFIPWVCKQWCASIDVIVTRKAQGEYIVKHAASKLKKSSRLVSRSRLTTLDESTSISTALVQDATKKEVAEVTKVRDKAISLTATYDTKHQLVALSIVGSNDTVPKKIFHAISLTTSYHPKLTRFTFRKSGLTDKLIYEINKLLPISNITEICLDDSWVPEGNYYILLENITQLKYLSLNRCKINDEVCMKIIKNIDFESPSSNTLQVLELGTNNITDISAKFIGSVLRVNRCLLHLNLSGNKITDHGFYAILDCLVEFPLNYDEKMSQRRSKMRYLQNKTAVYTRCLHELTYGASVDGSMGTLNRKTLMKRLRKKAGKAITVTQENIEECAETMALGIVGGYNHPFSDDNVVVKNNLIYCKGNLVLCYLNIAYNNLSYLSVKRVNEVLKYQDELFKSPKETGLIKITLDGNYVPQNCIELGEIDYYLNKNLTIRSPPKKQAIRCARSSERSSLNRSK